MTGTSDLARMREPIAPITDDLVHYIARFGGMCRECADNDGVCPNSGLPCEDVDKAIRAVLKALNYGVAHRFVPSPLLDRIAELEGESATLTKALTGLTCGGSEFFVQRGDRFVADTEACVAYVRRAKEDAHKGRVEALKRALAAEAQVSALQAQVDGLRAAIKPFLDLAVATTVEGSPDYRDWIAESKDWTVVFSFGGCSINLGQLRVLADLRPSPFPADEAAKGEGA